MKRAGAQQNSWGISTPFFVNHEIHSFTLGFTGLGCLFHPWNRKVIRRHYSSVRDRGHEPCFRQTKDVIVPYVPLETYPGSKIVHLILQGLDIGEHCRMLGRGGLWALFLGLLRIPARFLRCFSIRRLWGLFKWPLFISAFRNISNGHNGLEDKVSWNKLV